MKEFVLELYSNSTDEEALSYESELIKIIGRVDLGTGTLTNLDDGGCKHKTNVSKSIGEKISATMTGRKLPLATCIKVSQFQKGRKHSKEHVSKRTQSRIQNGNTKPTEATKLKSSITHKKKYYNDDGSRNNFRLVGNSHKDATSEDLLKYSEKLKRCLENRDQTDNKNPMATRYILISPQNEIHKIDRLVNLEQFCNQHILSCRYMRKFINKGIIDNSMDKCRSPKKKNANGWCISSERIYDTM